MTVSNPTIAPPSPYVWSYSNLHTYETCPRQFHETKILKRWPEEKSEHQIFGDKVHAAMALALQSGEPLPLEYAAYQPWIDKVMRTKGELLIECKWAITKDYQPTTFFSKTAWARGVADAVKVDLNPPEIAMVVDWKTGKSINVDELQLTLMALMAFIQFPKVLRVRAVFVWLREDEETNLVIDRSEMADQWAAIVPRVNKLQQAIVEENFPPTPNRLCQKWCSVLSCEYNGRKEG
jgi:hypothetical protein